VPTSTKRPRLSGCAVFWLLILAFIGLMVWKPVWRAEVIRVASPYVRRGAEWAWGKIQSWRPWERHEQAKVEPSPPVESPEAPTPETPSSPASPETEPAPASDGDTDADGTHPFIGPEAPASEPVKPGGNLPPRLPPITPDRELPASVKSLLRSAKDTRSPLVLERLGDAAGLAGFHAIAGDAYRRESELYRKRGDSNTASFIGLKAGEHYSDGRLYLHEPAGDPKLDGLARLEPPDGCLLGAFIDRDDQLESTFWDENWQTHRSAEEFEERIGKQHASLFCYLSFGRPFPFEWANKLKEHGIIPHIAWEPKELSSVDQASVERFADELARFDAPVFVRFAGEMNGDWTPYHADPKKYRQTFRMVHDVISRRAPKAALIWCVNTVPENNIEDYYPGDDAVDWVGVNMYNVLFFDNDRSRPADKLHPADLLDHVYRKYAKRKPVAICEYAASHQSAADPNPRPQFAVQKIAQLYSSLPRLYPRVKLVDWFDCNNLKHARAGRQLNNYSLTEDASIEEAYRRAVSVPYFLGRAEERPSEVVRPLKKGATVQGIVTLSACVRTPIPNPKVYLLAGQQVLYAGDQAEVINCRWDTRALKDEKVEVRLLVLDRENRRLVEQRQSVRVKH
jgi:hypothetical protein